MTLWGPHLETHLGNALGDHTWGLWDHTWGPYLWTTFGNHTWGPHWGPYLGTTFGNHTLGDIIRAPHLGTILWGISFGDHIWGPPQWAHDVEYTLECRHDVITLKTTSIRRRNSVVEMTSIFLVDVTLKLSHN